MAPPFGGACTTIAEEKGALRARIRAEGASLSAQARRESDGALFARLSSVPEWRAARTLLLYCGMGAEPDTLSLLAPLLAQGKTVALPRCLPDCTLEARRIDLTATLLRHPYGMLEPGAACPVCAPETFDLILVPGLAFDRSCNRLGQGGGYYDRFLPACTGFTLALCRDRFLLPCIPCAAHDRPVDAVVTETALFRLSHR